MEVGGAGSGQPAPSQVDAEATAASAGKDLESQRQLLSQVRGLSFDSQCLILEALPSAVLVVTRDASIAYCNQRAAKVLERDKIEVIGMPLTLLFPPFPGGWPPEGDKEGKQVLMVRNPSGEVKHIGFNLAKVSEDIFCVIFRDITTIEVMRQERDRLLQLAAVGDILPTMLHELKNPLASINMMIELLAEESSGPLQEQLHAVLMEVRRLGLTLDGVGRFQADLWAGRPSAIDHAVQDACSILEPQARKKGVELRCEAAVLPLLPISTSAIRAIVFNLVMNSIHACGPHGVITLTLSLPPGSNVLQLTVFDTGTGMSEEVLSRCRELFFSTKPQGSGIGLALCNRLVESTGGKLEITSMKGRGTSVQIEIPIRELKKNT
ncbi:MAG: PAS domain-containing protein [Holophagaceae bacterium]|nr:PAS domain-containing protein [Holophagaceae bacterium]